MRYLAFVAVLLMAGCTFGQSIAFEMPKGMQPAGKGPVRDTIKDPKCKPWEGIMEASHYEGDIQVVERKWCETGVNGFPDGGQILAQFYKNGAKDFEANYWNVHFEERYSMSGDCGAAAWKITLTNIHHIKPYRDKYYWRLSLRAGDCGQKDGEFYSAKLYEWEDVQ